MATLYLCGAGNGEGIRLARQVDRARPRWDRIVVLDDDARRHGTCCIGLPVLGGFDLLADADPVADRVVNLVTRTTGGRARAATRIAAFGVPTTSLVHPGVDLLGTSLDLPDDELDAAAVTVYAHAWIGAGCSVGRGSVALVGAVVGHGSRLGVGCVVAPNAVVNARVVLGDRVYVGSNATILPDVHVGDDAVVAANTLVIDDVPAGATVLGVPAATVSTGRPDLLRPDAAVDGDGLDADRATHTPSELARAIAGIVCELLSLDDAPHGANFFDLGGTSTSAVRLAGRIADRLRLATQPLDVFSHPTIESLAAHYASAVGGLGPASTTTTGIDAARTRGAARRVPVRPHPAISAT